MKNEKNFQINDISFASKSGEKEVYLHHRSLKGNTNLPQQRDETFHI